MKKNRIKILLLLTIVAITLVGYKIYYQHKKNMQTIAEVKSQFSEIDEAQLQYKKIVNARSHFLEKLNGKNFPKKKELDFLISELARIELKSQDDFDRFEAVNAQLGQFVMNEISSYKDGSHIFFKTDEDIRQMERIDRTLDFERKKLSEITFEMSLALKGIKKVYLFTYNKPSIPHFQVDHLILENNRKNN